MIKCFIVAIALLHTAAVISCGQNLETQKLISEINANRTKCLELTGEAEAKRTDARKQYQAGRRDDAQKSIDDAASLYGQIAKLLNESADKGDKIVTITTTDWYKEYFKIYSNWTRNLGKLAGAASEELLIRKDGAPSEDQLKAWRTNIAAISKENDVFVNQIAKIESEHRMVPVDHD